MLSTRRDSKAWWESASQTIFAIDGVHLPGEMADWFEMWRAVASARFTSRWTDEEAARAAYDRHNAEVQASVPPERLVDWKPGDGWGPLCEALALDVPDDPFPHLNTREEFPRVDEGSSVAEAVARDICAGISGGAGAHALTPAAARGPAILGISSQSGSPASRCASASSSNATRSLPGCSSQ